MKQFFFQKYCRKVAFICFSAILFTAIGCTSDDPTIILPTGELSTGIVPEEALPAEIRTEIEKTMSINEGTNPPNIVGEYKAADMVLTASSLSDDEKGDRYADQYISFFSQTASGNLSYYEESGTGTSYDNSDKVNVVGNGNSFTAYFIATGESTDNIYVKTSVIISGTVTSYGITNYQYAFILLDKGPDPDHKLVDVSTYRQFEDEDGLAERYLWRTLGKSKSATLLPNILPNILQANK